MREFFLRNWKFLVLGMVLGVIFGVIVLNLIPPVYEAKVRCVPNFSKAPSGFSLLAEMLGTMSGENPLQISLAIIKSDKMAEDIAKKFNLKKYFKTQDFSKAKEKTKKILKIKINPTEGTFILKVRMREPELAAKVANFCIKHVDELNEELNLSNIKPLLKVIDPAEPPDKVIFPKAEIILPLSVVFSLFLFSFVMAFVKWVKEGGKVG